VTGINTKTLEEFRETAKAFAKALNEIWEALKPMVEEINKMFLECNFPIKKERHWQRVQNIKAKEFMRNYKSRMFCVGNKGNYRRY